MGRRFHGSLLYHLRQAFPVNVNPLGVHARSVTPAARPRK